MAFNRRSGLSEQRPSDASTRGLQFNHQAGFFARVTNFCDNDCEKVEGSTDPPLISHSFLRSDSKCVAFGCDSVTPQEKVSNNINETLKLDKLIKVLESSALPVFEIAFFGFPILS